MRKINAHNRWVYVWLTLLPAAVACSSPVDRVDRSGWQRQQVDWRMTGGSRVKAVRYPADKPLPTLAQRDRPRPAVVRRKTLRAKAASPSGQNVQQSLSPAIVNVIDSPPIDGFVPWIAVSVTDARNDEYELDAVEADTVTGNYLSSTPESDYAIGVFDTGASASLISYNDASRTGMYDAGLVTSSVIDLIGVTGIASAWASQPLGVFIDGLKAIEPNGLILDDSAMVGEINVSIIVGDPDESPHLPTAVGAPLAFFFAAVFQNGRQITVTQDENEFTAPHIRFYPLFDSGIPHYSNKINLELRPTDVIGIQYFPCIEGIFECPDGDGSPLQPTVIANAFWTAQGLFFVSSVDVTHGTKSALDKDGFMFDTGAQVSVISEAIATRLRLNPDNADFEAEIMDVTGDVTIQPGFYIDSLEITAMPEWLSFTNVPVVMLDVDSPEGGYLDGIIGMNLFVDLNFVFHGGGLTLYGGTPPYIEFEPVCRIIGDITPEGGDCAVDFLDLAALAEAWLTSSESPDWNPKADLAPQPDGDRLINLLDFAALAEHWLQTTAP
jgi:predicted aspartyl protease